MTALRAALTVITALALGVTAAAWPAQPAHSCRGLTDGIFCLPLARGWHGSVGFEVADSRPAAWMLVGDFSFRKDAATHEGRPRIPPHRVLISIGDVPFIGGWAHWRRVECLRLPGHVTTRRVISWHVRFAGRVLLLSVRFGSRPDDRTRRRVSARLASVRRVG